jgi:hypothetical protein
MSLVKAKQEARAILDFSKGKISKNSIKESLRKTEVVEVCSHEDGGYVMIDNYIKVGMYKIHLTMNGIPTPDKTRLKDYGCFRVAIYETNSKVSKLDKHINEKHDKRFKDQYWVKLNCQGKLRIKNLVDVIIFTNRLDKLRMFL